MYAPPPPPHSSSSTPHLQLIEEASAHLLGRRLLLLDHVGLARLDRGAGGDAVAQLALVEAEVAALRQRADAAEQELELAQRGRGLVLRHHVAREPGLDEGEAALGVRGAHDAAGGPGVHLAGRVVRHEELAGGFILEALLAVPRHVLDRQQRAVGQQDVVEVAVGQDGALAALDHARQDLPARRIRRVRAQDAAGALVPLAHRRVDGLLHRRPVEVDLRALGQVAEAAGEAQHIPEQWAGGRDLVDIEAWIRQEDGVEDVAPQVTAGLGGGGGGQLARRRERHVLLEVVLVAAAVPTLGDVGGEGRVQVEQTGPVLDEGEHRDLILQAAVGEDTVVDHRTGQVVVLLVLGIQHGMRDVRDVDTSIRLARNVDLLVVEAEGVLEVLEEAQELVGDLLLVGVGLGASAEAGSTGLLDPDPVVMLELFWSRARADIPRSGINVHVSELIPAPRVLDRLEGTVLPDDWSVLLEEALQRRATRTTLEAVSSRPPNQQRAARTLSQMVISSLPSSLSVGKNQK
jgi:hypothetical protein